MAMKLKEAMKAEATTETPAPLAMPVHPLVRRRTAKAAQESGTAPAREGKKAVVGYFDPDVSHAMGLLALNSGQSREALLGRAINLLMIENGMPIFPELELKEKG